jgi:hypothetical protein
MPRPVRGDGSHGLTEPEPEPKRTMVRRQRWLCPEQWAAVVVVGAAMRLLWLPVSGGGPRCRYGSRNDGLTSLHPRSD